jgi:hypothetical protein
MTRKRAESAHSEMARGAQHTDASRARRSRRHVLRYPGDLSGDCRYDLALGLVRGYRFDI